MKILLTGATGLVGKELGKSLVAKGHELVVISRSKEKASKEIPFPCQVIEADLVASALNEKIKVDGVFHLLGESVAGKRWNKEIKNEILVSRTQSTKNLIESLADAPSFLISASAIGYYGDRPGEDLTEESSPDSSYLSKVCQEWEKAVFQAKIKFPNTQVSVIRIGVVLAEKGGALDKMLFPFKAGLGGALASGKQMMSWIHLQDLVHILEFIQEKKLSGIFNGVAPESNTNLNFSRQLADTLQRPLGPAIPEFAIRLLFGEVAQVVISDQKVNCKKLLSLGFNYTFKTLKSAFDDVLKNQKKSDEYFISEQFIPLQRSELYPFFSEAKNLEEITPDSLSFKIKNVSTAKIEKGTLIDYDLKIHGIPAGWKTLIEEWQPLERFVDTQLKGPYKLWHHTHEFVELANGTLMRDKVRFQLPFGFLGWVVANQFVKADVKKIFNYRRNKIYDLFVKEKIPRKN